MTLFLMALFPFLWGFVVGLAIGMLVCALMDDLR